MISIEMLFYFDKGGHATLSGAQHQFVMLAR